MKLVKSLGGDPETQPHVPTHLTLHRSVLWTALSIACFFLVDAVVFRSGWYLPFLAPNSSAGQLEIHLRLVTDAAKASSRPQVLVIGDSRIAEGFSARKAEAAIHNQSQFSQLQFSNAAVSGMTPRSWFYFLRDADPTARRFAAIVLPIDGYADQDRPEDLSARITDLNYVIGRLRLTDCAPFAASISLASIPDRSLRTQVFGGCVLKGITLRQDVKDFFAQPRSRIRSALAWRQNGATWLNAYAGKPENLVGLSADWQTRQVNFPPGLTAPQQSSIMETVMPAIVPQTGTLTSYRQKWLGAILNRYKASPTRIIFIEIPRAPLAKPESGISTTAPATFIDSVRNRPGVTVLPANTFRDLERPDLFADGLHLNSAGQPIFSERLARKVAGVLLGGS